MGKYRGLCHYIARRSHWTGTVFTRCGLELDEHDIEINPWFASVNCPICLSTRGPKKGTVR